MTAIMDTSARIPSPTAPKYPTKRASVSLSNCLEEVPDDTSPWKPEMAPQAMVMNSSGNQEMSASGLVAGAVISGLVNSSPKYRMPRPTTNWCELIKSRGCNNFHTGKVEAM